MRVITYNVNGLRSAISKGFTDWLATDPADVVCLQEIKAHKENVDHQAIEALGYQTFWFPAHKKGYSGVAIFTKIPPKEVFYGNGKEQSDLEGRVICADFADITLVNAYFPSGTSGEERQNYKYIWLNDFFDYLNDLRKTKPNLIVCGDYNICHKQIDIHDPVGNKNSSGFLPEERAWMDKFFAAGFVDTLRHFNSNPDQYSWWSFRAASRERNKGWRIDYVNVTEPLKSTLKSATIMPDVKHSDHCPVFLELKTK
jgi:exodeoxyribonuclease III